MKKIIVLAIFSIALCFTNKAEAKGIPIPVSFGGEKINTIMELPKDSTFMIDGHYVNVGVIYKQFSIVWIPLWNWDEQYCLVPVGQENTYYSADKEELESILGEHNIKLAGASPSFWNKFGGKLIVLAIIAFLIWGSIGGKKKEENESI